MKDQLLPAILVGALILGWCMSEPGGLDGSIGFFLGFFGYFAFLNALRSTIREEIQMATRDRIKAK